MDWLNKRPNERNAIRRRKKEIANDTPALWESLSRAMKDSVKAYYAAEQYGRFEQDANTGEGVYAAQYLEDTPNRGTRKEENEGRSQHGDGDYHRELSRKPHSAREVKIEANNDGLVYLSVNGTQLQAEDAAAYLLDPFLFPDLADTTPSPSKPECVYNKRGVLPI
jgi:hypothetical protein